MNSDTPTEKPVITKEVLIKHFLLFRVGGNALVILIVFLLADILETNGHEAGKWLVTLGAVTIIGLLFNILQLIGAIIAYHRNK